MRKARNRQIIVRRMRYANTFISPPRHRATPRRDHLRCVLDAYLVQDWTSREYWGCVDRVAAKTGAAAKTGTNGQSAREGNQQTGTC